MFDGVWFAVFSNDHSPPHVHGQYGDVLVIVDLLPEGVRESVRASAVVPSNASGIIFGIFWTLLRRTGRS